MPYIERSMSVNAALARDRGLLPLSGITAQILKRNNFIYPKVFFKWLCRKGYIRPAEFHHASASKRLFRHYDPKSINFVAKTYNLEMLYSLYGGKISKSDIYIARNVEYIKVATMGDRIGVNRLVYLDCISVDGLVLWSHETAMDMKYSKIVERFRSNAPICWKNPNRSKILRRVIIFKKITVNSFR